MIAHLIKLLAAIIAGLAGASIGGPLGAFTGFVSIFATLAYVGPQNATQRAWWQTDILHRLDVIILMAVNPIIDRLVIRITGKLPAYTGETIRFDPDTIPTIPNDDRSLWYICGICNMYVAPDHSCNALPPRD